MPCFCMHGPARPEWATASTTILKNRHIKITNHLVCKSVLCPSIEKYWTNCTYITIQNIFIAYLIFKMKFNSDVRVIMIILTTPSSNLDSLNKCNINSRYCASILWESGQVLTYITRLVIGPR